MLNRFRKNRKAKQELEAKQEVTQEMDDVLDTTPDEIDTEYAPEVDVEEVELEPLEEDEDDEYISDEEWEKMSPEEKAEFEDEDEDDEDEEDDDDYISDEEWEKMTPAERKAWEDEESPELGEGDDDTEYIMNDPEMVGYDDKEQQRDIYDFATEELEGEESVLDFGCGREKEFLLVDPGKILTYALNKYGLDTGNVILDHSYTDAIFKLTVLK